MRAEKFKEEKVLDKENRRAKTPLAKSELHNSMGQRQNWLCFGAS